MQKRMLLPILKLKVHGHAPKIR